MLAEGAAAAALSLSEEGGSPEVRAEACWRASKVFAQRGRWEAALELADRARCLLDPVGDRIRVAELHRTYPVTATFNGVVIKPFEVPRRLTVGQLSAEEWQRICRGSAIADLDLAQAAITGPWMEAEAPES